MRRASVIGAVSLAALASGCGSTGPCSAEFPANAPASAVYVAVCGDDSADGTFGRPFRSVRRALATDATYVAIGDGEFEEALEPIGRSVTLRGAGPLRSRIRSVATPANLPRAVVQATSTASLVLEDLGITGDARAGVLVSGGAVDLRRVRIVGIVDSSLAPLAHGVAAVDARLTADALEVGGNAGWGIVATRSVLAVRDALVERNRSGGIAIVDTSAAGGAAIVQRGVVRDNVDVGVAVFGGALRIEGTTIARTIARGGAGGDGVLAVSLLGESGSEAASSLDIVDAQVSGNARAGVLVDGGARGTLTGGLIGENGRVGLWLQGGRASAPFSVTGATFDGNVGSGVVATSGSALSFSSSTVSGTKGLSVIDGLGSVTIGDGFSVFDGASAAVTGSTFGSSARVAVLVDAAASSTTFAGNRVTMTGDSVVVQGGAGVTFGASTNTLTSGARVVDAGSGRALATVRGSIAVATAP